jgi:ABC-2 type transport system ATP-binding protein
VFGVTIIESTGLARRFRRTWALRDCDLAIPSGHVVALAGPNGAGKTTLLNLAAGLLHPTAGSITVLAGEQPGSAAARDKISFVAQDAPLYRHLPAGAMLRLARNLNPRWDDAAAQHRVTELGIPLDRKVSQLSGGQRAQLALTIALAKRPEVLILDEPLAALDPLARHDLMASLMAAVAQDGLSVVFSSHVVSELERIADYLVVLNGGRLQVAGEVDALLARHRILTGPSGENLPEPERAVVLHARTAVALTHLLVRSASPDDHEPPGWQTGPASLEDLVLAYLRDPAARLLLPVHELAPALTQEVTA